MIAVSGRLADLSTAQLALLLDRRPADEPELREKVTRILLQVRDRGDEALRDMALRFDGVELDEMEIPRERWDSALEELDTDVRGALERAIRNLTTFHSAQLPTDLEVEVEPGVRVTRRSGPLAAVGVYAPGGRASYPSSVLMGVAKMSEGPMATDSLEPES